MLQSATSNSLVVSFSRYIWGAYSSLLYTRAGDTAANKVFTFNLKGDPVTPYFKDTAFDLKG